MTHHDQYIAFAISRWLGATFAASATVVGAGTILDIFFLHERGLAFAIFGVATLFGVQFGGTTSGYIVEFVPWPVQFWWTAGALATVILLAAFVMPHTDYPRTSESGAESVSAVVPQRSYVQDRIATLFPGSAVVYSTPEKRDITAPFLILVSPVTLITGFFLFVAFAWVVAVSTLLAVFLQTPVKEGGYGYTPLQNADFTFCQWAGVFLAECYVALLQDRIPLMVCQRRGGVWRPEYRLVTLIPLICLLVIGLGIFGSALQYHLSIGALAVGIILIDWAGSGIVPILNNYLSESFTHHPIHASAALNFYRLLLGLTVPFFIDPWTASVDVGWAFGMMAFFTLFAAGGLALLGFKGREIRAMTFKHLQSSEDGEVVKKVSDSDTEMVTKE